MTLRNSMTSRSTWIVALAATTALGLAACGSQADGAGGGDAADGGLTTVRVASTVTFNKVLSDVAIYGELGEEHGIRLEKLETLTADSAAQLAATQVGDVDISLPGLNSVVDYNAAGGDLRIFSAVSPYAGSISIANDAIEASGVSLDAPIEERLQALQGLDFAAGPEGSTSNAMLRMILNSAGMDADADLNLIPLRDMSNVVAVGLQQGTYDAAFAPLGTAELAIASGDASVLGSVPLGDFPVLDGYSAVVAVATPEYIEENPETIEAILATYEDAATMIREDPDAAGQLVKDNTFPELDQATFDAAWEQAVAGYDDWDVRFTQEHWDMLVDNFDDLSEHDYASMSIEEHAYLGE